MKRRLSQRTREETGKLKYYIDNTMSKRIVGVKGEVNEIVTQGDNKLQEIDRSVKERTKNL